MKPDTETALTALWARDLLIEAGLPAEVWQVVLGDGPGRRPRGRRARRLRLLHRLHPHRPRGRPAAPPPGWSASRSNSAARTPCWSCEDADLDKAAAGAVRACFSSAGQLCISIERLYVHESVADAFLERFAARTKAMRLGTALAYGADMGSLVGERQLETVTRHVEEAVAKGAKVARRRRAPARTSARTSTSRRSSTASSRRWPSAREETFGPVVSVYRFTDEDEAVERANATPYGLNSSVWTQGRPARPRGRRPAAHRHRQRQRGLRRRVRQRRSPRWAA